MTLDLRDFIRNVPDFPKAGIVFKDITPLLGSDEAFNAALQRLAEPFFNAKISKVAGIESRGFIFGACLARMLGAGFVPVRKAGKLPWTTKKHEYELEYGSAVLEIHEDAIHEGERVLIVDDVLATGGTAAAAAALVSHCGGSLVGFAILIELGFLDGRKKLDAPVHSVIHYQ